VRIKRVRLGRGLTNIDADLVQNGVPKITARLICGTLPDMTKGLPPSPLTIQPPSPLTPRIPIITHPSASKLSPNSPKMNFEFEMAEDRELYKRNQRRFKGEMGEDNTLEWGAWCQLTDQDDRITQGSLPFFADVMKNLPELLPKESRPGPSWFATVVMSIEFKSKIPAFTETVFAPRTVGLYSSGRFLSEGRHDAHVEVWTAPSPIGSSATKNANDDAWRGQQTCLAISNQMALTIPLEVNLRRQNQSEKKTKSLL